MRVVYINLVVVVVVVVVVNRGWKLKVTPKRDILCTTTMMRNRRSPFQ